MALSQLPVVLYFVARSCLVAGGARGLITAGILPRRPFTEIGYLVAGCALGFIWMMTAGVIIQWSLTLLGHNPEEIAHTLLVQLLAADQLQIKIAIGLSAIVAAPIIEECIFRGLIQSAIRGGLISLKAITLTNGQAPSPETRSKLTWLCLLYTSDAADD